MIDPQRGKNGSVPSVPQVRHHSQGPVPRQSPFRMGPLSWLVVALLTVGLLIGSFVWGIDPDPRQFLAATSFNYSTLPVARVDCVSIDSVLYDRREFSDPKLADAVADTLSIKRVLVNADYAACPWGLFLTVVPGIESAVRYNGHVARYLVSVEICERVAEQGAISDKCLSKNIYVFTPRVSPHDLFLIGLVGLQKQQVRKLEDFQVKR